MIDFLITWFTNRLFKENLELHIDVHNSKEMKNYKYFYISLYKNGLEK